MIKRFIPYLVLVLVFTGFRLPAQQPLSDSVRLILGKDIPDTARAYNMVMLAMYT